MFLHNSIDDMGVVIPELASVNFVDLCMWIENNIWHQGIFQAMNTGRVIVVGFHKCMNESMKFIVLLWGQIIII